jgi:hypothetical protein
MRHALSMVLLLASSRAIAQGTSASTPPSGVEVAAAPFGGACIRDVTNDDFALTVKEDKFDGFTTTATPGARMQSHDGSFWFTLQRYKKGPTTTDHLYMVYSGSSWMFIEPGESLIFLADSERIALHTTPGEPSREVQGGGVREVVSYDVTPEVLLKLANAKTLQAKLVGTKFDAVLTGSTESTNCIIARYLGEAIHGVKYRQ